MKPLFLAALLATFLAAGPAAVLAQDNKSSDDPVVASVNGHEIRQSNVAAAYERLPAQYKQIPFNNLYPQLVEQLVTNHLFEVAGRGLDLDKDEAVLAQIRDFESSAIQQAYIERKIAEQVTEESILQVYEQTIGNAEGPEEVKASHILVKTEEEGANILKELAGGADFAELARKHSTGPSGPNGGDLGYFTQDAMVEPFATAAFALAIGAVGPDPVKTQFGWHVIKVIDKRRKPPADLAESRARIQDLLTREFITAHMAELRANAEIETFNLDGTPGGGAPTGGAATK
jgi:peptidyl-prolyl cis-trans isomerase C